MKYYKYRIKIVPDNPTSDTVKNNTLYIVGTEEYVKWAYFKCPCGCKETIMLPLNKGQDPSWRVVPDLIGRPNIFPSILKTDGCKSHFWIKRGKAKWS